MVEANKAGARAGLWFILAHIAFGIVVVFGVSAADTVGDAWIMAIIGCVAGAVSVSSHNMGYHVRIDMKG